MRAPAERPLRWMLSRAVVWPDLAFVRNARGRHRLVYSDPAGSTGGISDTFEQLDEFLLTLASCC
jgi:hypothetical protein